MRQRSIQPLIVALHLLFGSATLIFAVPPELSVKPDRVQKLTPAVLTIQLPPGASVTDVSAVLVHGQSFAFAPRAAEGTIELKLPGLDIDGAVEVLVVGRNQEPLGIGRITFAGNFGTDFGCEGVGPLSRFPFITIAEFNGRKNLSRRYWRRVGGFAADKQSSIRICFDKTELARDARFQKGTISLSATIGDRSIEVDGYSEVGTPQSLRTADFDELKKSVDAAPSLEKVDDQDESDRKTVAETRLVAKRVDELLKKPDSAAIVLAPGAKIETLRADVDKANATLASYDAADKEAAAIETTAAADAKRASETYTAKEVQLKKLNDDLAARRVERNGMTRVPADEKRVKAADDEIARLQAAIRTAGDELTTAAVNAKQAESDRAKKALAAKERRVSVIPDLEVVHATLLSHLDLARLREFERAYRPGEVDDGEIFLSKADAKPRDVLRIYLLHYRELKGDEPKETIANTKPMKYTLAEVFIDDYGYHRLILDSFLLIKRHHEPHDSSGNAPANLAPSNYKGTGGVSMLWSKTARPNENHGWRDFSPSWGINVSYLNWDTTKEIEIGAGLVGGLFDNQVHFGWGWNLNAPSNRGYYFIGFSFAAIEKKLTSKEPVK